MAARKRDDRKLRFYSMNFEKLGVVESSLDEFQMGKEGNWPAYPKGMMWAFCQKGFPVEQGFDIVLYGNIPNGSGLSSSASVETVTGVMLRDMFGYDTISMIDIALYGQFSENNYNGVNCGIMDQFAIAMGKKDCAIFLDTSDLKYEYAPVKLEGARIVISCSNKKRGLGDSKYNERRSECETALAEIQKVKDIKSLGELTEEEFEATLELIRKVGYMQLFTFIYSKRNGTPAAKLPDPTTHAEKAARMDRLLKTQEEFAFAATAAMAGQTVRVLVEAAGRNEGTGNGRLDNNLVVEFTAPEALIGQWAMVRITGSRAALLVGELAE